MALTLYALYLYSRLRGLYVKLYVPRMRRYVGLHAFHVDPIARVLYPYLLYLDLTLYYLLGKLLCLFKRAKLTIFDRFYLDALVDAIYACKCIGRLSLRLFISMHMRTSKAVVLDVDADTALTRKRDIVSCSEVKFKRRIYLILAKHLGIPTVDARRRLVDVAGDVYAVLN
jgi:thymidylate kinase